MQGLVMTVVIVNSWRASQLLNEDYQHSILCSLECYIEYLCREFIEGIKMLPISVLFKQLQEASPVGNPVSKPGKESEKLCHCSGMK